MAAEAMGPMGALELASREGAYFLGVPQDVGSLAVGKLADFVLLDKNPHDVDPDGIMEINVIRTVMGGQTTYST